MDRKSVLRLLLTYRNRYRKLRYTKIYPLAQEKPLMVEAIELRYFAGLTLEQIAEILDVSERTVSSYWTYAKAWLYREIAEQ